MVAHLLEVHDGALPPWLAPTQVVVLPVVDDALEHARAVRRQLHANDIRVELDDRDATLASRVRDAQRRRIPYVAIVGRDEARDGSVAVRLRDSRRLEPQPVEDLVRLLGQAIASRSPDLVPS
jgi:threonyl-tRNA synthetase